MGIETDAKAGCYGEVRKKMLKSIYLLSRKFSYQTIKEDIWVRKAEKEVKALR